MKTIEIHIGIDSFIDGSAYRNERVRGKHYGRAVFYRRHSNAKIQEPRYHFESKEDMQYNLESDLNSGEPVRIKGVPKEDSIFTIEVPLVEGMDVIVGDLDIQAEDIVDFNMHEIRKEINEHGVEYVNRY